MLNRDWKKRLPMDLTMDILGGLIYALGLNCFCSPNDIAPGGMSGVAVILNYLFDFPMGITIFCINIPLLLLAWPFHRMPCDAPGAGRVVSSLSYIL